jgi:exoribonuclease R
MPAATTTEIVQQKTDEKVKSAEQVDLEEAETAITGKDYKTARALLEKLGKKNTSERGSISRLVFSSPVKLQVNVDDEESVRIKESALLALGKLFKEIKDAKGMRINILSLRAKMMVLE